MMVALLRLYGLVQVVITLMLIHEIGTLVLVSKWLLPFNHPLV